MKITDVRIRIMNEDKLKGFANIVLDDSFLIRGMKIIRGRSGFFISMPSRRRPDGSHMDLVHPVNSMTRRSIEETILRAYVEELKTNSEVDRRKF